MTYKDKHERNQHHNMILQSQVFNIHNALKLMLEYKYDVNMISLLEFSVFRPPKTPSFRDVQAMSLHEDCFVQSPIEFFATLL
jgi:hypothetical protein